MNINRTVVFRSFVVIVLVVIAGLLAANLLAMKKNVPSANVSNAPSQNATTFAPVPASSDPRTQFPTNDTLTPDQQELKTKLDALDQKIKSEADTPENRKAQAAELTQIMNQYSPSSAK